MKESVHHLICIKNRHIKILYTKYRVSKVTDKKASFSRFKLKDVD